MERNTPTRRTIVPPYSATTSEPSAHSTTNTDTLDACDDLVLPPGPKDRAFMSTAQKMVDQLGLNDDDGLTLACTRFRPWISAIEEELDRWVVKLLDRAPALTNRRHRNDTHEIRAYIIKTHVLLSTGLQALHDEDYVTCKSNWLKEHSRAGVLAVIKRSLHEIWSSRQTRFFKANPERKKEADENRPYSMITLKRAFAVLSDPEPAQISRKRRRDVEDEQPAQQRSTIKTENNRPAKRYCPSSAISQTIGVFSSVQGRSIADQTSPAQAEAAPLRPPPSRSHDKSVAPRQAQSPRTTSYNRAAFSITPQPTSQQATSTSRRTMLKEIGMNRDITPTPSRYGSSPKPTGIPKQAGEHAGPSKQKGLLKPSGPSNRIVMRGEPQTDVQVFHITSHGILESVTVLSVTPNTSLAALHDMVIDTANCKRRVGPKVAMFWLRAAKLMLQLAEDRELGHAIRKVSAEGDDYLQIVVCLPGFAEKTKQLLLAMQKKGSLA